MKLTFYLRPIFFQYPINPQPIHFKFLAGHTWLNGLKMSFLRTSFHPAILKFYFRWLYTSFFSLIFFPTSPRINSCCFRTFSASHPFCFILASVKLGLSCSDSDNCLHLMPTSIRSQINSSFRGMSVHKHVYTYLFEQECASLLKSFQLACPEFGFVY